MSRFLRLVACFVIFAIISAAQCSASCLAVPCDMYPVQHSAHQCHHPSPEKGSHKCPLKQYQLKKTEPAVDRANEVAAGAAELFLVHVAVDNRSESVCTRLACKLTPPPGPPLSTLSSKLQI